MQNVSCSLAVSIGYQIFTTHIAITFISVCLQKLKDNDNALLAFERSANLVKNHLKSPLVFLNSAIFLFDVGRVEASAKNFERFVEESKEFVLSTEVIKFCVLFYRNYILSLCF